MTFNYDGFSASISSISSKYDQHILNIDNIQIGIQKIVCLKLRRPLFCLKRHLLIGFMICCCNNKIFRKKLDQLKIPKIIFYPGLFGLGKSSFINILNQFSIVRRRSKA